MGSSPKDYADGVYDKETGLVKFGNCCWYTNLAHGKRPQLLALMTMKDNLKFSKHKEIMKTILRTDITQKVIAQLFDVEVPVISKYLVNIYETGELEQASTISISETVQQEDPRNVKRKVKFYNLDAIIVVGCRKNWESAFQKMHLENDGQLLINDVFDNETFEEWK